MRTLEDIGGLHGGDVLREYLAAANVVADYIVGPVVGGYGALSLSDKPSFSHPTDAGVAVQSAVDTLGVNGGTILLAGDLAWGSVPGLPRSIVGKPLTIRGVPGAKVTLSVGGPRLFDFAKQADHDTFQNIEITDLLVDVNNVGGRHHVVLGTYVGGVFVHRVNIQQVAIRRVRTINVPTDSTVANHRLNVYLVPLHNAAAEGTQNVVQDILVEDCRFEGGNVGVTIGGAKDDGSGSGLNILVDRVTIRGCWHSLMSVQTLPTFSSANFFVGSVAKGGSCLIENCYGQYSGDVGVEVDAMTDALVRNVTIEDSINLAFYHTNYNTPVNPSAQSVVFENCKGRRTQAASGTGWKVSRNNAVDQGKVVIRGCSWYRNTTDITTNVGDAIATTAAPVLSELVIDGFKSVVDNVDQSSASSITFVGIQINLAIAPTVEPAVRIDKIQSTIAGTRSGAGAFTVRHLGLEGGAMQLDLDDFAYDTNVSNATTNNLIGVDVGLAASSIRGSIRRVKALRVSSDTGTRGIQIRGTGTLTVAPGYLSIAECDFRAFPSGGTEIFYVATSNVPNIRAKNNQWKNGNTKPVPATLAGLTTATGAPLNTGWDAIVQFVQGSGTAITAIDVSTNGGTTYKNVLTQASGALPAGFSQSIGPLPSDALIKVTFTGTQPTINLIPANP